jgi:hypothetical protein
MDKTPKSGTRRRSLYDLLVSRPGEWIDFDPQMLGYASPRSNVLKTDVRALRELYDLEIETAALRATMTKGEYILVGLLFACIAAAFYVILYL